MVKGVLLRNSSIISQNQSFIHFLYILVMNYELLGWANKKLTHSLTHWANGLPMGLNNNGSSRPLAPWVVGFLGRVVGRGLFDDP